MPQLDESVTSTHSPSAPPPALQAGGRRVLIVHGDPSYRRTLAACLEARGLVPIVRASGREALLDAADLQADVLLMDLEGDEFEEVELLTCFAALKRRFPAVVCSAYAESNGPELNVMRDLGVRRVLPRPCRFDLVVRALCELDDEQAVGC
jgi:DNA-binding NarL/FixJ family response regulator